MTDQEQPGQGQMGQHPQMGDSTPPGNAALGTTQSGGPQGPAPASPPAPLTDEHVDVLAKAAQAAHYAETVAEEIIQAAPQYINDAKTFIAMFNAAFAILQSRGQPAQGRSS